MMVVVSGPADAGAALMQALASNGIRAQLGDPSLTRSDARGSGRGPQRAADGRVRVGDGRRRRHRARRGPDRGLVSDRREGGVGAVGPVGRRGTVGAARLRRAPAGGARRLLRARGGRGGAAPVAERHRSGGRAQRSARADARSRRGRAVGDRHVPEDGARSRQRVVGGGAPHPARPRGDPRAHAAGGAGAGVGAVARRGWADRRVRRADRRRSGALARAPAAAHRAAPVASP